MCVCVGVGGWQVFQGKPVFSITSYTNSASPINLSKAPTVCMMLGGGDASPASAWETQMHKLLARMRHVLN